MILRTFWARAALPGPAAMLVIDGAGATGARDEQAGTAGVEVGRQADVVEAIEAGRGGQRFQHFGREPQPDVAHVALILLAVVRLHVDDDETPARFQRAGRLGQRGARLGDVVEGEEEDREIELAVGDRQPLELALPHLDVVEAAEAGLRRLAASRPSRRPR